MSLFHLNNGFRLPENKETHLPIYEKWHFIVCHMKKFFMILGIFWQLCPSASAPALPEKVELRN